MKDRIDAPYVPSYLSPCTKYCWLIVFPGTSISIHFCCPVCPKADYVGNASILWAMEKKKRINERLNKDKWHCTFSQWNLVHSFIPGSWDQFAALSITGSASGKRSESRLFTRRLKRRRYKLLIHIKYTCTLFFGISVSFNLLLESRNSYECAC